MVLIEGRGEGGEQWKDEGFSHLENSGVLRNNFTARKLWPMSFLNVPILDSSHSSLLSPSASPCIIPLSPFDVFIPHVFVDYDCVLT